MLTQLILPIHPPDAHSFQNFYTGNNAILLNCLKSFSLKIGEPYVYIWGSSGAGCTHLLQACCHAAQQQGFSVAYLPLNTLKKTNSAEIFRGLETVDMVCIDELESLVGDSIWQESLFHFYNRLQQRLLALQQRAHLRGLEVSLEVGQFLLLRLPRDSQALFSALVQLDKASLSLKRKLTIPLVKNILKL